MTNSPFKFLDSYTLSDRDIFFGPEAEIEEPDSELILCPFRDKIFIEKINPNKPSPVGAKY